MTARRRHLIEWLEGGHLDRQVLPRALRISGVYPSIHAWGRFTDRYLLWFGLALFLSGLVSFFAANWGEIGRIGRFFLIDVFILIGVVGCWRFELDSPIGRASLALSIISVGVLLAVIGQTYQTGADDYELFATWALLILPWVILARFPAFWLFWLCLVNLAAYLYFDSVAGTIPLLSGPDGFLWLVFLINTTAMCLWEILSARDQEWMRGRLLPRILAMGSGLPMTMLAVSAVLEWRGYRGLFDLSAWMLGLSGTFLLYRRIIIDVFMLAGGVLSLIVVIVAAMMNLFLQSGAGAFGLMLIAVTVLGLSALGGWWLTRVANSQA